MTKRDEKIYFDKIGQSAIKSDLNKPFSDYGSIGTLLSNIAAVFSLMPEEGKKVIDLGCGVGYTSDFLARAGYDVVGVDISKTAVDVANKKFGRKNLKFVYSDFDSMKFKNEFDTAIFIDSLHHCDDEAASLKSVYKTLKKGGRIIICEPGSGHSKSNTSINAKNSFNVTEKDMPPKLLKKALRQAGFGKIKVYPYPAKIHRFSYKTFLGNKSFANNMIIRSLLISAYSTGIMKRRHGVVTAEKN